ncbi:MAG TPA: lipid-A-disaccharide synthase [Candidatus Binataceae bacterium]|jgi:lipid-A-disaccharide synthase|nr:lipid-A-disaccharide synthase [Candidatus Binataceae bacterium]
MSATPREPSPNAVPSLHRRRVMIVAGEASGDLHGADLAAQILARDPECELFGIAGERMRAAGVRALTRTEDIAGLGFVELASTIRRTLGVLRELKATVRRERPDLVILIDFAEFNMSLARAAKRSDVPVLYYITPQVWAWRRGRVARIIERTDRLAVVLPFEAELYADAGSRVTFVGHPLLDRVAPAQDRAATLKRHGLPAYGRLLALLPGSRRGEVRYLLRPMVEAARVIEADHGLTPVIVLAPTLTLAQLREEGRVNLDGIRVIEGDTYSIVAASELALAASGTATLETALLGCPMVVAYKASPLTYALARMLVRGVDFLAMPNILAGREVVPEFIQGRVNVRNLVRAAENLMIEPLRTETRDALLALRARLGEPGASARVAAIALEMMA